MVGLLLAAVTQIASPVKVDGVLDEDVWRNADWQRDFKRLKTQESQGEFARKTEFAVLADARTLYVGVRCQEPDVGRLKGGQDMDLWQADSVELFLCPTGSSFDYYHFAASPVSRTKYASFASEGGAIRPDPYAPTWTRACAFEKDAWTAEFAIPLSSLYMTRNADWRGEWLFNVTRTYRSPSEYASWSPLESGFGEPKRFRTFGPFPARADGDDFAAIDIQPVGDALELTAVTAVAGEYVAEVAEYGKGPVKATLVAGKNALRLPVSYPRNGRFRTHFRFVRTSDGAVFERDCPVMIDRQPIRVRLTTPQYRNNFYPGQKVETVSGSVAILDGTAATVTLEGPGFRTQTAKVADGGSFSFDVRGFAVGDARLTVKTATDEKTVRVRNLPRSRRQMVWVEDGHLVVDGRPVLRRNFYAEFYKGGEKLDTKYRREIAEFHITPEFTAYADIQPDRLVPGLERKEGVKDVKPCKEYFAKLDEVMAKYAERDFGYYYIIDEPECRGLSRIYLKHIYDYVAERDPYHPILTASRGGKAYLDCFDWAETHPYLSARNMEDGRRYGREPCEMGSFLDAFGCQGRPDKVIGFLPTCFAYRWQTIAEDYPTFDEYVLHVWAAMSHGGKSLWPYAYHDVGDRPALYEGTKYVFESFEALSDLVLLADRRDVRRGKDADVVLYSLGDDRMLVAVNFTKGDLAVEVPDCGRSLREFRGNRTVKSGDRLVLAPFEVFVATALPHDAGLRPFAAVRDGIAAQENARTGRDNQLLERYDDITCEANFKGSHGSGFYKLIDGMYDQLAKASDWKTDAYWQFSFRNGLKPVFDRLVVHGSGIFDKVEASVFADGAWTKLPVAERVKTDPYRVVVTFDRPYAAEKLRLDFPGVPQQPNAFELYEIELPRVAK